MPEHDLLRHTLATLAYRGGKAVRGAPETFADFRISDSGRTPAQILAHIGDLLDWALSIVKGKETWRNSPPLAWPKEVERFHAALGALDAHLSAGERLHASPERIFQGPIADALTHVGQLAMLRRLAGSPVRGENYSVADIAVGLTGAHQPPPKQEFG